MTTTKKKDTVSTTLRLTSNTSYELNWREKMTTTKDRVIYIKKMFPFHPIRCQRIVQIMYTSVSTSIYNNGTYRLYPDKIRTYIDPQSGAHTAQNDS